MGWATARVAQPVMPIRLCGHWLALLAGLVLAGSAMLPYQQAWLAALTAIILLGVPHGALDGEVARDLLRPAMGRGWFLIFALPYLSLAALVLAAWHVAPLPTLAMFLAASVWHFGSEDAGPQPGVIDTLVQGGLPIAVPVLVHPIATARVLGIVSGLPGQSLPGWLWAAALAWLALAVAWAVTRLVGSKARRLAMPAFLVPVFTILPPLSAFAIYFVVIHAPAHMAALIADRRRAVRVRDWPSAIRHALPITTLTLLLGALLWPHYAGAPAARLLSLTIQGLAALTLPHMLLEAWFERRVRVGQGRRDQAAVECLRQQAGLRSTKA